MNDQVNNLSQLHDLMLPASVSWWPLAPGWYGLFVLLLILGARQGWKAWQRWRANAYRRAALRELALLNDASAIAELLRRTALAVTPRATIAGLVGDQWVNWLLAQCNVSMPKEVHQLICSGIYAQQVSDTELALLREYASGWISRHAGPSETG